MLSTQLHDYDPYYGMSLGMSSRYDDDLDYMGVGKSNSVSLLTAPSFGTEHEGTGSCCKQCSGCGKAMTKRNSKIDRPRTHKENHAPNRSSALKKKRISTQLHTSDHNLRGDCRPLKCTRSPDSIYIEDGTVNPGSASRRPNHVVSPSSPSKRLVHHFENTHIFRRYQDKLESAQHSPDNSTPEGIPGLSSALASKSTSRVVSPEESKDAKSKSPFRSPSGRYPTSLQARNRHSPIGSTPLTPEELVLKANRIIRKTSASTPLTPEELVLKANRVIQKSSAALSGRSKPASEYPFKADVVLLDTYPQSDGKVARIDPVPHVRDAGKGSKTPKSAATPRAIAERETPVDAGRSGLTGRSKPKSAGKPTHTLETPVFDKSYWKFAMQDGGICLPISSSAKPDWETPQFDKSFWTKFRNQNEEMEISASRGVNFEGVDEEASVVTSNVTRSREIRKNNNDPVYSDPEYDLSLVTEDTTIYSTEQKLHKCASEPKRSNPACHPFRSASPSCYPHTTGKAVKLVSGHGMTMGRGHSAPDLARLGRSSQPRRFPDNTRYGHSEGNKGPSVQAKRPFSSNASEDDLKGRLHTASPGLGVIGRESDHIQAVRSSMQKQTMLPTHAPRVLRQPSIDGSDGNSSFGYPVPHLPQGKQGKHGKKQLQQGRTVNKQLRVGKSKPTATVQMAQGSSLTLSASELTTSRALEQSDLHGVGIQSEATPDSVYTISVDPRNGSIQPIHYTWEEELNDISTSTISTSVYTMEEKVRRQKEKAGERRSPTTYQLSFTNNDGNDSLPSDEEPATAMVLDSPSTLSSKTAGRRGRAFFSSSKKERFRVAEEAGDDSSREESEEAPKRILWGDCSLAPNDSQTIADTRPLFGGPGGRFPVDREVPKQNCLAVMVESCLVKIHEQTNPSHRRWKSQFKRYGSSLHSTPAKEDIFTPRTRGSPESVDEFPFYDEQGPQLEI